MSFNFTGTTGRRNINLGNRNLMQKNKSAFLKSAQLEREKREAIRKENHAAVVLQSACRNYLDLYSWRKALSGNWNGAAVTDFKYFFPYLINSEDPKVSMRQLHSVKSHLNQYNSQELNTICQVLSFSVINLNRRFEYARDSDLLSEILCVMRRIFVIDDSILIDTDDQFTLALRSLLKNGAGILNYVFSFSEKLSPRLIIEILFPLDTAFVASIQSQGWALEFSIFFHKLANKMDSEFYSILNDTQRLSLLYYISTLFTFEELSSSNRLLSQQWLQLVYSLTNNFTHWITFEPRDEALNGCDLKSFGSQLQISSDAFDSIQSMFLQIDFGSHSDDRKLISSIASSLHFISLIRNEKASSLKSHIDMKWLLKDAHKQLIKSCYNGSIGSQSNLRSKSVIPGLILDSSHEHFWSSLSVLLEYLITLISITPDTEFIKSIAISETEFSETVSFLKWFCSDTLLVYRDISKPTHYNSRKFLQTFKKSLTFLYSVYNFDISFHYYPSDFWIKVIDGKPLDFSTIEEFIPLIDILHNELKRSEILTNSTEEETDFLANSRLFLLNKNIPKKVADLLILITYLPFMAPFEQRATFFNRFVEHDRKENRIDEWFPDKPKGIISREDVFLDSYEYFGSLTALQFKSPFSVEFINQFGEKEAGIDGGGLTKELLTALVPAAFVPTRENRAGNKGLQFFRQGTDYKLYCSPELFLKNNYEKTHPNTNIPFAVSNDGYLKIMRFLGMVLGKCLYENILLNVSFTRFFLNSICRMGGRFFRNLMGDKINFHSSTNSFDQLADIDPILYQSLNYMLRVDDESALEEMGLTCSVVDEFEDMYGVKYKSEVVLIASAEDPKTAAPVTNKNKMQYVRLLTHFKLTRQSELAMKYFVEGLFQIIQPHWLLLFNPDELQTLIVGANTEIDIQDLRQNTVYNNYTATDPTIRDLFDILNEFNEEEKSKFVKFVTSSSKQPLCGFKELNPSFAINRAGDDPQRLPTASTCMNLLKLPDYQNKALLREKLSKAINSNAGFDLS